MSLSATPPNELTGFRSAFFFALANKTGAKKKSPLSGRVRYDQGPPPTPPQVGSWCRRNFISFGYGRDQNKLWLTDPNPKPTPAWLSGAMRRPRAMTKNVLFRHMFLPVF